MVKVILSVSSLIVSSVSVVKAISKLILLVSVLLVQVIYLVE